MVGFHPARRAAGRVAALMGVLLLLAPSLALGAGDFSASSPSLPGSTPTKKVFSSGTDVAIPDLSTVEGTIAVSGMGAYLWDVDVYTEIAHTWVADLDVRLVAPNGRTMALTTNSGGSADNLFNGTWWDDQATETVTRMSFTNGVAEANLVPEGALGRMRGVNPNGTWKLRISDENAGDPGTLGLWRIRITTFSSEPFASGTQHGLVGPVPIVDQATTTSGIMVSGHTQSIFDVDLTTQITHTWNGDLYITLTSPEGTSVLVTAYRGGSNDNVFANTRWGDQVNAPVTDHTFVNMVSPSPLNPEGAMSAFNGEDPNGTWTLSISDANAGDVGTLNGWSLSIQTGSVLTCDGKQATKVRFSSGTVTGTSGSDVIAVRNGTFTINGKGGDDTICGAGGADTISGGAGDDRIFGGKGGDTINGNDGADYIYGQAGSDSLAGGPGGSDLCVGGTGSDSLASNCETKRQ